MAVVVNTHNSTENVTRSALARIYRGEMETWEDGQRILALNLPIDSEIRRQFYRMVLNVEPTKQFFKPGSPVPFKTMVMKSYDGIRRFVARTPNAIGYLPLSEVDDTVAVLKVDGTLPGEPGYALARVTQTRAPTSHSQSWWIDTRWPGSGAREIRTTRQR